MPKVRITATETYRYNIVRDMSDEAYAEYMAAVDGDESEEWFRQFADRFIRIPEDLADADTDGIEDFEITLYKEKKAA